MVGEAVDGRQAVEMARELMPDVILMDISMPVMDGLEATRRIKEEMPDVRIVILTASDGDRSLFEAVKSGAQAYLLREDGAAGVVSASCGGSSAARPRCRA